MAKRWPPFLTVTLGDLGRCAGRVPWEADSQAEGDQCVGILLPRVLGVKTYGLEGRDVGLAVENRAANSLNEGPQWSSGVGVALQSSPGLE